MIAHDVDGVWRLTLRSSSHEHGAGIAKFENGRVFGADHLYWYQGNYTLAEDGRLTVKLTATHHGNAAIHPVFAGARNQRPSPATPQFNFALAHAPAANGDDWEIDAKGRRVITLRGELQSDASHCPVVAVLTHEASLP